MKHLMLTAALLLVAAGCQNKTQPTSATPQPVTQASAKPVNAQCVVHKGDDVDPKVTYLYQGKVIGFCCEKCVDEFKKDPDKYVKDLK